jgi:superfamily II RNA helicase
LKADLVEWDTAPLLNLAPLESCLKTWGLLQDDGTLTERGIAATEVNEGHPLLMPHLAASNYLAEATAYEVLAVLAGFLQESAPEAPSIESLGLTKGVLDTLYWLDTEARTMQHDEDKAGVLSPPGFWNLSAIWIGIVWDWLGGTGLSELALRYEMFEGNLQRGLLRVANILEEWIAIATLRRDLRMLEKLQGVSIFRNELIVDSLYLRL